MPAKKSIEALDAELGAILREASARDFADPAEEEAWLAEHGVTFERCSAAQCDRCRVLFSADYEPDVGYGEPLKTRCIRCGGPTYRGY